MTPKRKIIKNLVLAEVSAVGTPAVEEATVRIMKSADGHQIKPVTKLVNIRLDELSIVPAGANQFSRVAIAKAEEPVFKGDEAATSRIAAAMLAAMKIEPISKSHEKEPANMSNESNFERLLRTRIEKTGESRREAFAKLAEEPSESGLAAAYDADERAALAARLREGNDVSY